MRVSQPKPDIPDENTLAVRLMETKWPAFEFKRVSEHQLEFVENYAGAELVYPPLMHGSVLFDPASSTVHVTGVLNYFAAAVVVAPALIVFVAPFDSLTFGLLGLGFAALCYAVQARRYAVVLSVAALEWMQPLTAAAIEANKSLQPIARETCAPAERRR